MLASHGNNTTTLASLPDMIPLGNARAASPLRRNNKLEDGVCLLIMQRDDREKVQFACRFVIYSILLHRSFSLLYNDAITVASASCRANNKKFQAWCASWKKWRDVKPFEGLGRNFDFTLYDVRYCHQLTKGERPTAEMLCVQESQSSTVKFGMIDDHTAPWSEKYCENLRVDTYYL